MRLLTSVAYPLALIATLALAPLVQTQGAPGGGIPHLDKVVHVAVYGLLALLILRSLPRREQRAMNLAIALAAVTTLGILDELHQLTSPDRVSDWLDLVADIVGGTIALLAYRWLPWFRTVLEFRLWGKRPRTLRVEVEPREPAEIQG
jgi:VanZ family protein